jgi:hypothetical protein
VEIIKKMNKDNDEIRKKVWLHGIEEL